MKTQRKNLLTAFAILIVTATGALGFLFLIPTTAASAYSTTWTPALEYRRQTVILGIAGGWGDWTDGGDFVESVSFTFTDTQINYSIVGGIDNYGPIKITVYITHDGTITYVTATGRIGQFSFNTSWLWDKDCIVNFAIEYSAALGNCQCRPKVTPNLRVNTSTPTGTFNNSGNLSGNTYINNAGYYPSFTWAAAGSNQPYISATLDGADYTKNSEIQTEGTHTLILSSAAGKSTTYTIIVDRTAPVVSVPGTYTNAAFTASVSDANFERLYYRKGASGDYSSTTSVSYTVSAADANNGIWYFYAVDRAGNTSAVLSSTLDTVAPVNAALAQYTNRSVVFSATDATSYVTTLYYRHGESGGYTATSAESVTVQNTGENFGAWYFYAEDAAGNRSAATSCVISVVDTFGNKSEIRDSYKTVTWYKVTLPARIFGVSGKDISGTYTFGDYASALEYAITKETEYRVSVVAAGWIYVSATNESVAQIYTDRAPLDTAINKYASSYVSAEQTLNLGSNNYHTPVNGLTPDPSALTRQTLVLPPYLLDYGGLNLFLCSSSFVFTKLRLTYANVPSEVNLIYIANDAAPVTRQTYPVTYGNTIKSTLSAANAYLQGYYLVRESDAAGNAEEYIIYIDLEKPIIEAAVTRGDTLAEHIIFDGGYVSAYAGTFRFISFDFARLIDNADAEYLCVYIKGKGVDKVFAPGAALPSLNAETGGGKYTVTVYDRSMNALTFEIIIASYAPSWTYTNLANETKLTVTVLTNDNNNAIISLQLFKIQSDGTYIRLDYDDDGVPVDFTCLSYVLRYGGKYTVRVTDLFGRTVEFIPIFYQKGLPSGTLSGVNNGGRTNKEVTFKYPAGNTLTVYIYESGVKTVFTGYSVLYQNTNNVYILTFEASIETSYEYLLFLYKSDDPGLYIEYTFEIDCDVGDIIITDTAGGGVPHDGATNKSFSLTWLKNLTVRYYTSNTVGGEMGSAAYKRNTLLTADGLYYFICRDDVGNEIRFTVLLKSKVNYKIEGAYVIRAVDEVGNVLVFTFEIVAVRAVSFVRPLPDGYSAYINGEEIDAVNLTVSGVYTVTFISESGVEWLLTLEIDNIPPALTVTQENGAVKFSNLSKPDVTATLNGAAFNLNKSVTAPGGYTLTITDDLGNSATYTFTIAYKANGWAMFVIVFAVILASAALFLIVKSRRGFKVK